MNSEFKTLSIIILFYKGCRKIVEQSQFSWSQSLNTNIDCYTIDEIDDSQQGKKKYHKNNDQGKQKYHKNIDSIVST